MYLDTLKVSTVEQTAEQTTANGGLGNADLIAWDYGKSINVTLEDALYTPASQSLMWGGKFGVKKPKIRGLWNPYVYPVDTHGRVQYFTKTKLFYKEFGDTYSNKNGFYLEEDEAPDTIYFRCQKKNPFTPLLYVLPIVDMPVQNGGYEVNPYYDCNFGFFDVDHTNDRQNIYGLDPEIVDYDRFLLTHYLPDLKWYGTIRAIKDENSNPTNHPEDSENQNTGRDWNDSSEKYYFTFITSDLIEAYDKIKAEIDKQYANDTSDTITAFKEEFKKSRNYMINHLNEIGAFNCSALISENVTETLKMVVENYRNQRIADESNTRITYTDFSYENELKFINETRYEKNPCGTEENYYLYKINTGNLKYKDYELFCADTKLYCPKGYVTYENDKEVRVLHKQAQMSQYGEKASIRLENFGAFDYYNQPMEVVTEGQNTICYYRNVLFDFNKACTDAATVHSYVWEDSDLTMTSYEGQQDIYFMDHSNLRYRTPQNSSIKEISIASKSLYPEILDDTNYKSEIIKFSFEEYKKLSTQEENNWWVKNSKFPAAVTIKNFTEQFDSIFEKLKNGSPELDLSQETASGARLLEINGHYYGNFEKVSGDLNAFDNSEVVFVKPDGIKFSEQDGITYMEVNVIGGRATEPVITNSSSSSNVINLTSNKSNSNFYQTKLNEYSPVVVFHKTITYTTTDGSTVLIRVPVGKFYIIHDWNYDNSSEMDFPYEIKDGMLNTKVLERTEKCVASQTFAIDTSRNLTMYNYKMSQKYNNSELTVYIDPKTMKPYEPNANEFEKRNGDVVQGNLRIIKQYEVYYKWTRTIAPDYNSIGKTIVVDAQHYPGTFKIVGETYARTREDFKDQRYQFEIPKAKLSSDTNLTLQADGDPTTFSMNLKVLRTSDGQMMKLTQYNVEKQVYNGVTSGSTQVLAGDESYKTIEDEIMREVNAI